MYSMGCLRLLAFWLLGLSVCSTLASANAKPREPEPPSRYTVDAEIPSIVREDIIGRAIEFAAQVYPWIDMERLRRDFEEYLSADTCRIRVYQASGPFLILPEGSQKVGSGCSLTAWENLGVRTNERLGGLDIEKQEAPLSKEKGEQLAQSFLLRLIPDPREAAKLKMTIWGEADHVDSYTIRWEQPNGEPYSTQGKTIEITLRKSDTALTGALITLPLEKPKISFETIVATLKKEIPGSRSEYLSLHEEHHFADRRLVWKYGRVIEREGFVADLTRWDANTGVLLYSEVLNGGKPNRPYMNPSFYSYPTEDEVKVMVEELIRKRAEELEKREQKE